jgi:hypothetical protein
MAFRALRLHLATASGFATEDLTLSSDYFPTKHLSDCLSNEDAVFSVRYDRNFETLC